MKFEVRSGTTFLLHETEQGAIRTTNHIAGHAQTGQSVLSDHA